MKTSDFIPVIPAEQQLPELTIKVFVIAIMLAVVLAISNAYLALKIGMLTSASIPAAMIAMGILRLFKTSNILENNLIQTCASTGEAVAGGVVYAVPALILIHYWTHFDYWTTFLISLLGGVLGTLFSVPLRLVLLQQEQLRFPEGRAIAEVLSATAKNTVGLLDLLLGGGLGMAIGLCQSGFKLFAEQWSLWFEHQGVIFGFGCGFSATLIGTGYLIGFEIGLSLFIGALVAWLVGVPLLTTFHPLMNAQHPIAAMVHSLWNSQLRYVGLGGMLVAGLWTLLCLTRDLYNSICHSLRTMRDQKCRLAAGILRTEHDVPMSYVIIAIALVLILIGVWLTTQIDVKAMGFSDTALWPFVCVAVAYILIVGFIICALCGYFSGMVGVSASPGSSVIIAGMLLAAILIRTSMNHNVGAPSAVQILNAMAVTSIIGSIIMSAAAIANDNIQDLKVGQLVGSTPWKQQVMLLLGVIVGSLVIPPVMDVLFNVYGIGDVFPHSGMDPAQALPAPPAALMAAITQGVFQHAMPWHLFAIGGVVAVCFIVLSGLFKRRLRLSVIGMAIGLYLPLASSTAIFIGAVLGAICQRAVNEQLDSKVRASMQQRGILLACGLVAGAAIMNVILAIPFAIQGSPDAWQLLPASYALLGKIFSLIMVLALCQLIYHRVRWG